MTKTILNFHFDYLNPSLSALVKFKMALEDQKVQAENQLPSFYKRVLSKQGF